MCGIVGIISQSPIPNRDQLYSMRDTISHRGPDGSGAWWSSDGCVGLGHRRLAIIDLSSSGHQPMQDNSEELCIVFNGEIYNYQELRHELAQKGHLFRSYSDTEVILASYQEWGVDCLTHLNGMFAFALYDCKQRRLFMARDRAGEKPLFYALADGTLTFVSELKALMADPTLPRRIDHEALDCYLALGYVPAEQCILRGVQKLAPAHALIFDLTNGKTKVWRYWQLPAFSESQTITSPSQETDLLDELEHLLEDAVKRQLVADVSVGILLSGGVDSSLVTAMAARTTSKIKTFTIGFSNYGKYDETEHARLIARHFGSEHLELQAAKSTIEVLERLSVQFDEPIVDSSILPTFLVSQLIKPHCTVALGGDGGDELFGGYEHYNRLLQMQERSAKLPFAVRSMLASTAGAFLPLGFKGRHWIQEFGSDLQHGLSQVVPFFDTKSRRQLLSDKWNPLQSAEKNLAQRIPLHPDLVQRATRNDFQHRLADGILVKVDRASMLNSLEVRAPLLDYRIIEFAYGKVPGHLKTTVANRKILLKRLAARVLPSEFNLQRKQGFSIPLADWLQDNPWRDYFRDILLEADKSIFNREYMHALLKGQEKGRSNSERLFALVLFELWRKEYRASL